jgi:hypothetical protein
MDFGPRNGWTAWLRWPDAEVGPWYVSLTWSGADEGRAELVGFELWSRPPGSSRVDSGPEGLLWDAVSTSGASRPPQFAAKVLHDFPLMSVVKQTRRHLIEEAKRRGGTEEQLPAWAVDALATRPRGRLGREHFVEVAAIYEEAVAQGFEPLRAIRERWPVSKAAAGKWVSRARHEFGLLPPTTRGKALAFAPGTEPQQDQS